ncbi:MAG: hypothetical protein WDO17_00840 [Alphaproteobacteria bacterium]
MPATPRQPSFALLLGLAWLAIVVQLLAQHWAETALMLADTDDAMRLAQLRDWLAGQSWYDLNQARVAGGYESHWSRLIDAGLAATFWLFGLFAEPAMAERLMRTAWPMLWLLPTMAGVAAVAWRIADREAALIALLLAAIGLPAFHQFRPGRIDHHNVQIALSLLVLAATVWSDRVRWAALAAGAVTGLAMAVGLECLPYLIACAAAFALRYLVHPKSARAAGDYGTALAASSLAGFLVIVGPDRWSRGVCDEIAINWLALTVTGGIGLALSARIASEQISVRAMQLLFTGALAVGLFLWIEPRCLRGPYAAMDPAVWPIWLAHVREMKPLVTLTLESPLTGIAIATFPLTALIAAFILARSRDMRADFGFLVATAVFLVSVLMTLAAVKAASYAIWLAMPLVAVFALHLFDRLKLHALAPRVAVGVLLTPAVLSLGAITIANAAGLGAGESFSRSEPDACFKSESYAALSRLPQGVVAADIDYGPYLLALTPHTVVAAPYHRLSAAIMAGQAILASAPDQSQRVAARLGVSYIVTCGRAPPGGLTGEGRDASLWAKLEAGDIPSWLERIATSGPPFAAYRIVPR